MRVWPGDTGTAGLRAAGTGQGPHAETGDIPMDTAYLIPLLGVGIAIVALLFLVVAFSGVLG